MRIFQKEKNGRSEDKWRIYNKETCNKRLKRSIVSAISASTHLRSCDPTRANQAKNGIKKARGR